MRAEPVFVITGAAGYLGRRLVIRATARGRVFSATRRESGAVTAGHAVFMDVADRASVFELVGQLQPDAIIHTAAVNPGGDEAAMWRVNLEGSRHVAEAARAVGARLVAVSTDTVHNGRAAPYGDDVPPTPINAYGRSKAAGEAAIRAIDRTAVVVRPSLIYGLEQMDRSTAGFAQRIARGERLVLFSDVMRNPVWVETLADALVRLTATDYSGVLNVAGRQALSREEFGRKMLAYWGIANDDLILPGRAADSSDSIPLDLRLQIGRAEAKLGMTFPGVDDVLSSANTTGTLDE